MRPSSMIQGPKTTPTWMQTVRPMFSAPCRVPLTPAAALAARDAPLMLMPSTEGPSQGLDLGWSTALEQHYSLQKFIGSGSYGVIHSAMDAAGEVVAIKCMAKERPNAPRSRTIRRLAREAALMERLRGCHNIVQLLGKYEDTTAVYFVMELARGQDLAAWMQEKGKLSEAVVSRIIFECLHMLLACHAQNIVHADLKPNNLLVDGEVLEGDCAQGWHGPCSKDKPLVKLLDFGCSQAFTPGIPLSRRTGTPIYMAPEVYRKQYSTPADMWSLGVMMFQLITGGQFPFWGSLRECLDSSIEEVMNAILQAPLHTEHLNHAGVSPEGRALLLRMLDRDPATRITVDQALQHPWFDSFAGASMTCDCEGAPADGPVVHEYGTTAEAQDAIRAEEAHVAAKSNNVVPLEKGMSGALEPAKEGSKEPGSPRTNPLNVWAMMQRAVRSPAY